MTADATSPPAGYSTWAEWEAESSAYIAEADATSGANARHGDLVRNLSTGALAYVICGTQGGRVLVGSRPDSAGYAKWERYNIEITARQGTLI